MPLNGPLDRIRGDFLRQLFDSSLHDFLIDLYTFHLLCAEEPCAGRVQFIDDGVDRLYLFVSGPLNNFLWYIYFGLSFLYFSLAVLRV